MKKKGIDMPFRPEKIVYLVRVNRQEQSVEAASAQELAKVLHPLLMLDQTELHSIAHTLQLGGTLIESGNWRIRRIGTTVFRPDEGVKLPVQKRTRTVRPTGAKPPVQDWQEVEMPSDDLGSAAP